MPVVSNQLNDYIGTKSIPSLEFLVAAFEPFPIRSQEIQYPEGFYQAILVTLNQFVYDSRLLQRISLAGAKMHVPVRTMKPYSNLRDGSDS